MFKKEFLKQLTILFIEDDEITRTQLEKMLNRLFKKVIVANNGLDGYEKYQEDKVGENKIDLILSDINMPIMNGIEMLEKIRVNDSSIPVIFSTARTETEYLIKAISLGVEYYVLKPMNIEDTLNKIEKICEKKYYQKLIQSKTLELKEYLKIINKVSTIYKMDSNKNIIFANQLFLSFLGYSEVDDIKEKSFYDLISNDIDKNIIIKLWETLEKNEPWTSDIKYKNLKGEVFYIKSTFLKIINESHYEYICIGFDSTNEVNKKREFHKNILNNIKDKSIEINQSLKDLQTKDLIISNLENELKIEKQRNIDFQSQIKYYENELKTVDDRVIKQLKMKNFETEELKNAMARIKKEKQVNLSKILNLEEELLATKLKLDKLDDKLRYKEKRIEDLISISNICESKLKRYEEKGKW